MIIDSHAHLLPAELANLTSFYKVGWSEAQQHLEAMDKAGIDKAVLSYPTTDALKNCGKEEKELVKLYNDGLAGVIKRFPERFLGLAVLPINDEKTMLTELKRTTEELGFVGVSLASSYDGAYLDDERFHPLFEHAAKQGLPIFVHATVNNPIGLERVKDPLLMPVLEFTFDISMCVGKMMMSGIFKEFGDLTFVFAHFGGVLPILKERFDGTYNMLRGRNYVKDIGAEPSNYLKNIYIDTSGCSSVSVIKCALEMSDAAHILWGSDYPSNRKMAESISVLDDVGLKEEGKLSILGGNIEGLVKG